METANMDKARKGSLFAAIFIWSALVWSPTAWSQEIIIDQNAAVAAGDFDCLPCLSKLGSDCLALRNAGHNKCIEMTTGELWTFLDKQGLQSVNELSLFVEIDELQSDSQLNLSSLKVEIGSGADFDMGNSSITVPGYKTSASRPEAQISFDLGYDFMKQYSGDSTELIRFNIKSDDSSVTPTYLISATDNHFSRTHLGTIIAFVIFWGAVFLGLFHFMKPSATEDAKIIRLPATLQKDGVGSTMTG